jgi:chromate reductase
MTGRVRLLLVSGSTRAGSTNTAALRTACDVAPPSVTATLYEGLAELPAFNPDDDDSPHYAVRKLRQALSEADGVLFCTPEYAGSLPGSLKNLLDWTVGSGELYGKPVAWVNVAAEGRGKGAEQALASVLGYVGSVVISQACLRLPLARQSVGPDGTAVDVVFRVALARVLHAMVDNLTTAATTDDRS